MDHHILTSLVMLLLLACGIVFLSDIFKLPYTIALVIVGLIIAVFKLAPHIYINHAITFDIILPPLLFVGAMHMDLGRLKKNAKIITMLVIPGVIVSTLIIGYSLHYLLGLELIYALLFGIIITPTDPISVLTILKKVGAPERLRTILEGESLFNDGTGVVIFTILLGMISEHTHFQMGESLREFAFVTGGGTLIGLIVGLAAYHLLKRIDDHLLEVSLTVAMTFGTPLLAEYFHFSGIIAIVVAGLIIGNYGRVYSMSEKTCLVLETFWEVIEFIINCLLFLVIGIELQYLLQGGVHFPWMAIAWSIFALLCSRLIVVYPIVWIKNRISSRKIPWSWAHILFWGGLKGSLSIAMVVLLPESIPYRSTFLMIAFSIVVFSLIVQGLTMKPLLRKLQLSQE